MRRILRYLLCLLVLMVGLSGLGLLALSAGWLNDRIRNYARDRLAEALGTEVQFGDLRGNPLRGLRLEDVQIGPTPNLLLRLERPDLNFRLLPLLQGNVVVDTVRFVSPNARFNVDRAEIQFKGQTELDPDICILGTHIVRLTGGDRATISVISGGTLYYPQVTFETDPPMPMPDILSYLLLGRPAEGEGGPAPAWTNVPPGWSSASRPTASGTRSAVGSTWA